MSSPLTFRNVVIAALVTALVLLPLYTWAAGNAFLLTLFTRIVILAIAATSLNLIMGYGGMVSFGHAAYIGIGGYAVGMLAKEGITSGFVQWPVAVAVSALFALFVGALSLRTRGVYFIMITLAFAQMVYYVAVGLDRYGGDDGLTIYSRSQFAGLINLGNRTVFYYVCVVLLFAVIFGTWRVINSRFGLVIQGSRSNDRRMRAIGFPTFRYRLVCFVIAGMICGLAGALLANYTAFISPAMMHWTRSGDLIVMVVLGGMGSLFGPLIGAITLLVLEEALPQIIGAVGYLITGRPVVAAREYWQLILGPLLLLVVLFARGGIAGFLESVNLWLMRSSQSKA
jgi:branched-chain amino acid transport system permease protein